MLKPLLLGSLFFLFATSLFGQLRLVEATGSIYHNLNIDTPDGGALLVGTEACYIPGAIAIEGCAYARHLTRLDANADTLWTKTYEASNLTNTLRGFANADGGFTLFGISRSSFRCDGLGIGLFGLGQIEVVRTDALGEVTDRFISDNECDLEFKDVVRIGEDRYVVIAVFGGIGRGIEVRAMVMNGAGEILRQQISPYRGLAGLRMYINNEENIELHYYQDSARVREVMDTLFQTISTDTGPNLFDIGVIDRESNLFSENIVGADRSLHRLLTRRYNNPDRNETEYLRYDANMNLIVRQDLAISSRLYAPALHPNGEVWCVTTDTEEDDGDIAYYRIDTLGNVVGSEIVRLPGKQEPRSLSLGLDSLTLLIAGDQNCCGLPAEIGRSKTFYYTFGTTGIDTPSSSVTKTSFKVYPNPVDNEIRVQPIGSADPRGADGVLPVAQLATGIYWYQLIGETGILQTGKIIKK